MMMRRLIVLQGVTAKIDGADQHIMTVGYDDLTKNIEVLWPVTSMGWDPTIPASQGLNIPPEPPRRLIPAGEYEPDDPEAFPGALL